jgi:hypothetical protein
MSFWISVLIICFLEAAAAITGLRREWLGKKTTFTVGKMQR